DPEFHALGGMQALIWRAIQDAKVEGIRYLDLGRSDHDNLGLITFKDRWGAARVIDSYVRFPLQPSPTTTSSLSMRAAKCIFAHMPGSLLSITGRLLYKHVG